MCISDAAKTLEVKRDDLFRFMDSRRWIFKRSGNKSWLAYDEKRRAGYMEHDDHLYIDAEGRERVATRALVTAKGLVKLTELLKPPLTLNRTETTTRLRGGKAPFYRFSR